MGIGDWSQTKITYIQNQGFKIYNVYSPILSSRHVASEKFSPTERHIGFNEFEKYKSDSTLFEDINFNGFMELESRLPKTKIE